MHNRIAVRFFFIFFFASVSSHAFSKIDDYASGVNAGVNSDNILFSSPPLPLSRNLKGVTKITVQPNYFTGTKKRSSFEKSTGDYSGVALGFNIGHAFADRWAVMGIGLLSNFSGDFERSLDSDNDGFVPAGTDITDQFSKVKGTALTFGLGLSYEMRGRFGATNAHNNLFGGFLMRKSSYAQRLKRTDNNTATTTMDIDIDADPSSSGIFMGYLMDFRFGKTQFWGVSVFTLGMIGLGEKCQNYQVTAVRIDTGISGSGECDDQLGQLELNKPLSFAFGANLLIGQHLSINFISPIINKSHELFYDGQKSSIFSLSYTYYFGDYENKKQESKQNFDFKRDDFDSKYKQDYDEFQKKRQGRRYL